MEVADGGRDRDRSNGGQDIDDRGHGCIGYEGGITRYIHHASTLNVDGGR